MPEISAKTYVLVHGASHGGWCWRKVADRLRTANQDVYTPTQTGLSERSYLLSDQIDLNVFIEDLVQIIESGEINHIVLVGHSFAVTTITGIADVMPDRIRHTVYLDAIVPQNGQSAFSRLFEPVVKARLKEAMDHDGGMTFPPPDPDIFAVTAPEDVKWLKRRLTPYPVKTYAEPIALINPPVPAIRPWKQRWSG